MREAIAAGTVEKLVQLSGLSPEKGESQDEFFSRALDLIGEKIRAQEMQAGSNYRRVANILDVVMSMAKLDYDKKAELSPDADYIDGLAAGINMLGEELKGSTISLHEKEVLLKEVHHRVKNNLQVISSLLNLQSEQITDPGFREKYLTGRDRILSMALVHEKLYESKDFSLIDFNDYAQSLARSLNLSYNPDNARIRMQTVTSAGPLGLLPIETAIPCGLILNELLSNCFKYAFPGNRQGMITIRFDAQKDENGRTHFRLGVADNGVGLPKGFREKMQDSLGMQLVEMLAGQLGGHQEVNPAEGTDICVHFSR